MPLAALLLPVLLAAADAPITVTGHNWAPFISPMGEPFRPHGADDDTLADWFRQADRNSDGTLTSEEMQADADRFFAALDSDHNGELDPDEVARYEYEVAPDVQVMTRTRRAPGQEAPKARPDGYGHSPRGGQDDFASLGLGGALQGGARYGLLNIPEPVAAADTDFNRGVSLQEFRAAALARFALLDTRHQARLSLAQLKLLRPALADKRRRPRLDDDTPDARVGNPLPPGH